MIERKGLVSFNHEDVIVVGPDLQPGDIAPDFSAHKVDWSTFKGISDTAGKVRIIAAFLSLETSVCDREVRYFNQKASELSKDIVVLTISTDLPFTQSKWCGAAGIDQVIVLSDHLAGDFGKQYGCFIKDYGILRRAVFVIDRHDKVVYSDYMKALGDEPDYQQVLEAAKIAVSS